MKRRFLSLFAGVLLVGLVPAVAQASTSTSFYHQAQTFTAGRSGVLYGVDLFLNVQSPQTVQVFIRAVDGSGLPTGANLATSSVSLPVMQDWIHFPLSGSLSITTGSKYAIVFDLGTSFTTYSSQGDRHERHVVVEQLAFVRHLGLRLPDVRRPIYPWFAQSHGSVPVVGHDRCRWRPVLLHRWP